MISLSRLTRSVTTGVMVIDKECTSVFILFALLLLDYYFKVKIKIKRLKTT